MELQHAQKCVERFCVLVNKTTETQHRASTPSLDDHQLKNEELETVGDVAEVRSHILVNACI